MTFYRVLTIASCLFLFTIPVFSQDINPQLDQKTWLDGESRVINNYLVTKVFGSSGYDRRAYNFAPITSVAYKDLHQLKKEAEETAEKESWTPEKLQQKLAELDSVARGGAIEVYISRYNEDKANFKWFFIIIRGEDDKGKLWEHDLGYQAPQMPYERGWWNYKVVYLPVRVELPFYIYLNDKLSQNLSDFKFRIEKNTESQQ